jgi:hypothetical protein
MHIRPAEQSSALARRALALASEPIVITIARRRGMDAALI